MVDQVTIFLIHQILVEIGDTSVKFLVKLKEMGFTEAILNLCNNLITIRHHILAVKIEQ